MKDVCIIGSGPAGLTAAIYLARSGITPCVISGERPGGQLVNTDMIENYPGFNAIKGADLMMNMIDQAESLGSEMVYESVETVEKDESANIFKVKLTSGETIEARSVLIATGAKHRHLDVPGEKEFTNKGVSWCATCDGPMYRGKKVAVVGGGNTAVMEALFLSNFAERVFLIHRRNSLRAERVMQEKVFANGKIECVWDSQIAEIRGETKVSSVRLNTGVELDLEGVFIAVGTLPASEFVNGLAELDAERYVVADKTQTSCAGLFAAGDIVSGSLKQAIYAAGEGALAARYIEEYLEIR